MRNTEKTMEKIVALCKGRGFIFAGSEIYGGLANTWDYGPLGTQLKNNVKNSWRKKFIQERADSYEIDSGILMHPRVWEASGHVASFSDPLLDCKDCKTRHRADNLIEAFNSAAQCAAMSKQEMYDFIKENNITCPNCGKSNFTDIREFNLMFQTYRGVTNDSKSIIYLRPENAQGEYVNFLNVQRTMRTKLPMSIGQIGKAFRNEITPGNFTFRTVEFEQMEFQTFCKEGTDTELYEFFKDFGRQYYVGLGIKPENLRYRDHEKLAHYAKAACDIEYLFPFGWGEVNGTHNRTDFDLKRHQEYCGQKIEYTDPATNEKFIPYIVESTYGLDRTVLALLCEAYDEEELDEKGDSRTVLHLHPALAPIKCAVLPLSKKLAEPALDIYRTLSKHFMTDFDEAGSIGKRYRRQDEVGTPFCVTFDFDSLEDRQVTVRCRDSMEQTRVPIATLGELISKEIEF